jgi:hypothetical protein
MIILMTFSVFSFADSFPSEARLLVLDLKTSLVKNLSDKISQEGPLKAVPFCHANVKSLAKGAAGKRGEKYMFGRTSHKVRNPENAPKEWAEDYLREFQGKFKGEVKKDFIIHTLKNGKRIYMEPLFAEGKCLICHGESVAENLKKEILKLYPEDRAQGFKLGEFRGFIWVSEK